MDKKEMGMMETCQAKQANEVESGTSIEPLTGTPMASMTDPTVNSMIAARMVLSILFLGFKILQ